MDIQLFEANSLQVFIGLITITILGVLCIVLEHLLLNAKVEIRKLKQEVKERTD